MTDFLMPIISKIIEILQQYGFFAGFLIVILESIIPVLPLGLFVAFNFSAYGIIPGFIVSYVATICGCLLSYFCFDKMLGMYIKKKSDDHKKLERLVNSFKRISFTKLVLIIALPFSPAFFINMASGMVKMNFRKFFCALLIGKISIIYFWGMVGKSFLESISDIKSIIIIFLSLGFSYLLSKMISKKLKVE